MNIWLIRMSNVSIRDLVWMVRNKKPLSHGMIHIIGVNLTTMTRISRQCISRHSLYALKYAGITTKETRVGPSNAIPCI